MKNITFRLTPIIINCPKVRNHARNARLLTIHFISERYAKALDLIKISSLGIKEGCSQHEKWVSILFGLAWIYISTGMHERYQKCPTCFWGSVVSDPVEGLRQLSGVSMGFKVRGAQASGPKCLLTRSYVSCCCLLLGRISIRSLWEGINQWFCGDDIASELISSIKLYWIGWGNQRAISLSDHSKI